jgi:hypothetical protein
MIFNGLWTVYRIWIGLAFSGFGSRSLLIQRCKNYAAFPHFFVQGAVLPDEGRFYPTNGIRAGAKGRGRKPYGTQVGVVFLNVLLLHWKKFFLYFFIKR